MARKRMIDPSFWVDEKLGTVEPLVRLLFMGLISQADDEGRLNGHPALIRSLIYPYDIQITVQDVEDWLTLLASDERKLIVRYEVDYQKYILIPNFKKHQTINKPQNSKLPPPLPEHYGSSTVTVHDDSVPIEEKVIEEEEKGKEVEVKAVADPYIQVIDSFCDLHDKLQYHLKFNEREDAHKLLKDGMPAEFIISTMKKIHKQKTGKGEKISSFTYYTNAIIDAWKGAQEDEKYKGLQPSRNDGENEEATERLGWLPSKYNTPESIDQLPKVSGQ